MTAAPLFGDVIAVCCCAAHPTLGSQHAGYGSPEPIQQQQCSDHAVLRVTKHSIIKQPYLNCCICYTPAAQRPFFYCQQLRGVVLAPQNSAGIITTSSRHFESAITAAMPSGQLEEVCTSQCCCCCCCVDVALCKRNLLSMTSAATGPIPRFACLPPACLAAALPAAVAL
jgi:hypothetical protein